MELFNSYQNQILYKLIDYINGVASGNKDALDIDSFEHKFLEQELHMAPKSIEALLNRYSNEDKLKNICLLCEQADNGVTTVSPILNWTNSIPIRLSVHEYAWLYYVLTDYKSDLFITPRLKKELLYKLENMDLPNIREILIDNRFKTPYADNIISCFKDVIMPAIKSKRLIYIDNSSTQYLIYRIQYDSQTDLFSLLLFPCINAPENSDIMFLPLEKETSLSLGTIADNEVSRCSYSNYMEQAESCIKQHWVQSPITLLIDPYRIKDGQKLQTNADDRCSYLFSNYKTINYINDQEKLVMDIYYYDFQYPEIIDHILSLGKYVRVIGPQPVIDDVLSYMF